MKKRLYAFILTLCLVLSCFQGFSVTALDTLTDDSVVTPAPEESVATGNSYNKLHFYFDTAAHATIDSAAELQTATASVKADYAAAKSMSARSGEEAEENVYITVQFASDYLEDETYLELKADRENAKTALQRDTAKSRLNAYSKSYHQALVAENLPLLSALPYTHVNAIDYSSFVTLTVPASALNPETLAATSENENILHISLTDGFEEEPIPASSETVDEVHEKSEWLDVLECINAKNIVQSGSYTGNGIKVGVYENDGKCDVTNENLADMTIQIRNDSVNNDMDNDISQHATIVTSIIALLAPDVSIFYATEDATRDPREGIAPFIAEGCDVVNISFGISEGGYYRYDYDAIFDYQIKTSGVVVVAAAGNLGRDYDSGIKSPAYAYNVIAVGGVVYSSDEDGWVHGGSCVEQTTNVIKPNISAPYYVTVPNIDYVDQRDKSGTSLGAPLVTACVALMYEYSYRNIASYIAPEIITSVLIAYATETEDYSTHGTISDFDPDLGSGIVNLGKMLSGMSFGMYSGDSDIATGEVGSSYLTVSSVGTTVQIALTWYVDAIAETRTTQGSVTIPEYNIYLWSPSGNVVASSTCADNNMEFIRYTATETGRYRISIVQMEPIESSVQLGLAQVRITG